MTFSDYWNGVQEGAATVVTCWALLAYYRMNTTHGGTKKAWREHATNMRHWRIYDFTGAVPI